MKHEENGLVFEDSEELAVQLQVALSAPLGGSQAFGDLLFLQLGGWAWAGSAAGVAVSEAGPQPLRESGLALPAVWVYGAHTTQVTLELGGPCAI